MLTMPVGHNHDSLLLQGFSTVPEYSLAQQQQQQQQQLLQELSAALLVRLPEMSVQAGLDSSAALLQLVGAPALSLQQLLTQQQQQQQQDNAATVRQQAVSGDDADCYWAGISWAVAEAVAVRLQSGKEPHNVEVAGLMLHDRVDIAAVLRGRCCLCAFSNERESSYMWVQSPSQMV
jgi:mevalonate kinase